MLIVSATREVFLQCLPKGGLGAEIGVYKGDFSQQILDLVRPEKLFLVDPWSFQESEQNPFPDIPTHFKEWFAESKAYFGDDINKVLGQARTSVETRFAGREEVVIIPEHSYKFCPKLPDAYLDFVYIDANHQYEFVQRDLLEFSRKVKNGGIIFVNDFYDSAGGRKQNLGVVGAVSAFLKRGGYTPIALTTRPWSDLTLTNDPTAPYSQTFSLNLINSSYEIVEVPDELVTSYNHKCIKLLDGADRLIPSFSF